MKIILVAIFFTISIFARVDLSIKPKGDNNSIQSAKPLIWQVTKGDEKFYLFGTMHLPNPIITKDIVPVAKGLIDRADSVYTEIPLDFLTKMAITKAMMRDDNKTLSDILPKKTYQKLDSFLKSINPMFDTKGFDKMKIWAISFMLSGLEAQIKYREYKPLDSEIFNYALSKKKFGGGIEKVEEQLSLFNDFSQEELIQILDKSLDFYIKYPNFTDELLKFYFAGDTKAIDKLNKQSNDFIDLPKELKDRVNKKLLFDRNLKMTKQIEKITKDKKLYLFAFGAMHFIGKDSVVELLKKDGYIVKRVDYKEVKKDDKRD